MSVSIRPNVMKKRLREAEKLQKNNGGKLPNPWKMIQKGRGGLYRYIQRHQKEFEHFKVEVVVGKERNRINGRTRFNVTIREEHLKIARELARKNGGILQDTRWLKKNGYTRLASYMKTYPKAFVHV